MKAKKKIIKVVGLTLVFMGVFLYILSQYSTEDIPYIYLDF